MREAEMHCQPTLPDIPNDLLTIQKVKANKLNSGNILLEIDITGRSVQYTVLLLPLKGGLHIFVQFFCYFKNQANNTF